MDDCELYKKVAERIIKLREERGLSQQEFAGMLDYEKSNMSRLESGKVNIKLNTIYKVAQALNISMSELLDIKEKK